MARRIPATFVRGGTSKALIFRLPDLPPPGPARDAIFLAAMGSPDRYARQLDGMGGGLSSLSKVAIVGPSTRDDADVDYTFGQVAVDRPLVDYSGNCGNISSAIGPFAVEEGFVRCQGPEALVRIHNTNTRKIIESRFEVAGRPPRHVEQGGFALDGVSGTGSPVELRFLDPGGAGTGKLLPTGNAVDVLTYAPGRKVEASLVDAGNPCVFVRSGDLGFTGNEAPAAIDADRGFHALAEAIRARAAVMMGLAATPEEATSRRPGNPKFVMLAPPPANGGEDIRTRMVSMGNVHRAIAGTAALCLAAACRIEGTLAHLLSTQGLSPEAAVRIGHPGGIAEVGAEASRTAEGWKVSWVGFRRTTRRLMEGAVLVP